MQADHPIGPAGRRGNLVHVEIAGVGRQDRARLHDGIELAEHLLLDVHQLEHRLDHQVAIGEVRIVERAGEIAHRGVDLLLGNTALLGGILVIAADDAHAAVERVLLHLDHGDGDARGQEVHRDAAAHRARADYADLADGQDLGVLGQIVDLLRGAFGEEHVAQRFRLGAGDELLEQSALGLHAFLVGLGGGRLDCLDAGLGRFEAFQAAGIGLPEIVEGGRRRVRDAVAAAAGYRMFGAARDILRKGDGGVFKTGLVLNQRVEQAHRLGLFRGNGIAGDDHRQRGLDPHDAGKALRAARAGQDAQLHLGQAQLRRGHGDAVMAAQRNLQPAAQSGAVDRGDDGLGAILDRVDDFGQAGGDRRLAEFGDVRAREEGAPVAADHHRLDRVVRRGLLHRIGQPLPDRRAQRVDRRIVGSDDQHVALDAGGYHGHCTLLDPVAAPLADGIARPCPSRRAWHTHYSNKSLSRSSGVYASRQYAGKTSQSAWQSHRHRKARQANRKQE